MTALFYCSANEAIAPKYNEAARQAVRAAAARGYTIASGGTVKGTMRVVSEEALACGARTRGIVPRFMEPLVYPGMTETVWTDTMAERKSLMLEGADIAIALPGGIGTMDELFGTMVLIKLGKYSGKLAALNIDGFYDPLAALLDHFVATCMLTAEDRAILAMPRTVEELAALL
ncbi:MAG: TIGR00730 family Rossman fold protein [Bacteroidales bacterium]|nr:TIGR00730 family Rossman fold protein [Bacteroidales bacterium]